MVDCRFARIIVLVALTGCLVGCFQTSLGGTTGSTLLTLAPLRDPANVVAEVTTVDTAYWIDVLGQAGWDEKSAATQLFLLGIARLDVSGLDPDVLYVFTATGGMDYAPDGQGRRTTPEAVQGSWHAIASGARNPSLRWP